MPRYFFDLHDGLHVADIFGRNLEGISSAKSEAIRISALYATSPAMISKDGGVIVIIIRDDQNNVVSTIRLSFNIEPGKGS